jgi:hypothetical protein
MIGSDNVLDITAADLVTVGLLVALEGLLSADNAMVLAVLVLGLPKSEQRKALRYGIVGAFAFRVIAILFAVWLKDIQFIMLIGAAYLLWLPYNHFTGHEDAASRRRPKAAASWLGMNPFWSTVAKVELTDIVFAIDSILVAVALSDKTWVIITGGILGAGESLSDAGRWRVRHHRVGGRQAGARILARGGLRPLGSSQMALARIDRRDLRDRPGDGAAGGSGRSGSAGRECRADPQRG